MKWHSLVAGALASVVIMLSLMRAASADVRIVRDPGGEVSSYVLKFRDCAQQASASSSTGHVCQHAHC